MLRFKNQKIFISADWHQAHLNICQGTSKWPDTEKCRPFVNPDEMWEKIRNNTNRLVGQDDILINLGDVIFGDKTKLPEMLSEINCKNNLLCKGNHDDWLEKPQNQHYKNLFNLGVYDYLEVIINHQWFVFNHYAQLVWNGSHKGTIMCHGHSHNSLKYPKELQNTKIIDVGVDVDLYDHEPWTPFSIPEILSIMDKKINLTGLDHHAQTARA